MISKAASHFIIFSSVFTVFALFRAPTQISALNVISEIHISTSAPLFSDVEIFDVREVKSKNLP